MSTRRPKFSKSQLEDDASDHEYELDNLLKRKKSKSRKAKSETKDSDDDDEMATLSFGALSTAQKKIEEMDRAKKLKRATTKGRKYHSDSESESDSDGPPSEDGVDDSEDSEDEGGFFKEDDKGKISRKQQNGIKKKKNKHAPSESSSRQKVSKIRDVPGLLEGTKYAYTKHRDIRFDSAYGKVNLGEVRKNYSFLDDYRTKELGDMNSLLKDPKRARMLSEVDKEDIEYQIKSTKSRLESLKNTDMEKAVFKKYKKETGREFIKRGEKRKLIQVARFENMKGNQREKAMERKRKKKLGKEMRQFEFNHHGGNRD